MRLYRRPRVGQLATMIVGPTSYPVTIVDVDVAKRVVIWVQESGGGRVSMWRRRKGGRYIAQGVHATQAGEYYVRLGQ